MYSFKVNSSFRWNFIYDTNNCLELKHWIFSKHNNLEILATKFFNGSLLFFPWVYSDVWKLGRDFDISVSSIVQNNIIELRAFANQVFGIRSNWSLERLVLYVVSHSFIIMSMTFDSQVETWKTLQKSTARGGSQFVHYWPGHVSS